MLLQRADALQTKERRSLARAEKTDKKQVSDRLWLQYKARIDNTRERQKQERFALVREREAQLRTIVTFELAKDSLLADRQPPNSSPAVHMARVELIRQQMEEWQKRNAGPDFGR